MSTARPHASGSPAPRMADWLHDYQGLDHMTNSGALTPGFPEPSIARIYDYALGGKDNYPPDRAVFAQIEQVYPTYAADARANREFLARTVRWLVEQQGSRQLLDLGSGIPTSPNVHEVAQRLDPGVRVVYVDVDETAAVHGRAVLARHDHVEFVQADARDVPTVLASESVRELLDLDQPVGVLAYALLHFVDDRGVHTMLDDLRTHLAPGSLLACSIYTATDEDLATMRQRADSSQVAALTARFEGRAFVRTPQQAAELLTSIDLVPPGLVDSHDWPTPDPSARPPGPRWLGGVGRLTS